MRTLLLLWSLSIWTALNSQTWFPEGAKWVSQISYQAYHSVIVHEVSGDTIIGIESYKKLSTKRIAKSYVNKKVHTTIDPPIYVQERNGTVYQYYLGKQLLYDFTLGPGDTISSWNYLGQVYPVIVADTGRLDIDGQILRYQEVSTKQVMSGGWAQMKFIEKIGSVSSTFIWDNNTHLHFPGEGIRSFRCYEDVEISYQNPNLNLPNCEYVEPAPIDSIGPTPDTINKAEWALIPNPAKESIQVSGNFNESLNIKIVDLKGQIIFNKELDKVFQTSIQIADWPTGNYFIILFNSNGEIIGRKSFFHY